MLLNLRMVSSENIIEYVEILGKHNLSAHNLILAKVIIF